MRYFINGMFLQMGEGIGVRSTVPGTGWVAVFGTRTRGYIFSGVIQRFTPSSPWTGWVLDHFGYAKLFNVSFGEKELRFTKKYEGREDEIHCSFRQTPDAEGVFVGHYEGVDTGKNTAWCVLTEVSDRLFDEHTIRSLAAECSPMVQVVTLDDDQEKKWEKYKRAGGVLAAGEIPRVNSTVLLRDPAGRSIGTAYLNSNEMVGGLPGGKTRVTVSATVRTSFS